MDDLLLFWRRGMEADHQSRLLQICTSEAIRDCVSYRVKITYTFHIYHIYLIKLSKYSQTNEVRMSPSLE